jgi:tetratricopeptide (TPR) repeat protein
VTGRGRAWHTGTSAPRHCISIANANLGITYWSQGDYAKAIENHAKHLAIAKEVGDRAGEGKAHGDLSNVDRSQGDYVKAIEYHAQDKDEDTDNDYTIDTIDTNNDYTIDDTSTAHLLFLIPPHNPSVPTQAGDHVENAENAQEEEARNPVPIDDRNDTLDVATDPKDDHALAATYSDHHLRPRLHLRRQERRLRRRPLQPRLRQRLRPRHARAGGLELA